MILVFYLLFICVKYSFISKSQGDICFLNSFFKNAFKFSDVFFFILTFKNNSKTEKPFFFYYWVLIECFETECGLSVFTKVESSKS